MIPHEVEACSFGSLFTILRPLRRFQGLAIGSMALVCRICLCSSRGSDCVDGFASDRVQTPSPGGCDIDAVDSHVFRMA